MLKGITVILVLILITTPSMSLIPSYSQITEEAADLFEQAKVPFSEGDYAEAITFYDKILEFLPENISALKMKGVAQSNLGLHEQSLNQFYKIHLQNRIIGALLIFSGLMLSTVRRTNN